MWLNERRSILKKLPKYILPPFYFHSLNKLKLRKTSIAFSLRALKLRRLNFLKDVFEANTSYLSSTLYIHSKN